MSLRRLSAVIAAPAALLFALSACGGHEGRPSADQVKDAMSEQLEQLGSMGDGLGDEFIDCVAQHIVDSDLSDELLWKMVDGEGASSDEASEVTEVSTEAGTACVDEAMG